MPCPCAEKLEAAAQALRHLLATDPKLVEGLTEDTAMKLVRIAGNVRVQYHASEQALGVRS